MQPLKVIQGGNQTNTQESDSVFDSDICPECGTNTLRKQIVMGKLFTARIMCKCREAEYERMKQDKENNQKRLRLERLRQYSLMDKEFEEKNFDNFDIDKYNQKLYDMAKNYCNRWDEMKQKNIGFMFWGAPGTGKTYLACCIANELIKKLVPVMAISSIGILNRIKQTYNTHGKEGEAEIISSLKNASLLVLDDLGSENSTEWSKEKLYEIIDSRYRDGKPMIITINITREQLNDKLTGVDGVSRTYDRLIEMCTPIEVKGPSRRAKAGTAKMDTIKSLLE